MKDRVAMITGGARGIGRAIGLALAREGWSVALCYRQSRKEAEETVAVILSHKVRGMAVQCDVSDPNAAERIRTKSRG